MSTLFQIKTPLSNEILVKGVYSFSESKLLLHLSEDFNKELFQSLPEILQPVDFQPIYASQFNSKYIYLALFLNPAQFTVQLQDMMKPRASRPNRLQSHRIDNKYEAPVKAFTNLVQSLSAFNPADMSRTRRNLPAVHASPGLGKSTFLDEFAQILYDWQPSHAVEAASQRTTGSMFKSLLGASPPKWLETAVIAPITFNSNSGYMYSCHVL